MNIDELKQTVKQDKSAKPLRDDPFLYHIRVRFVKGLYLWSLHKKDPIEPQYTNEVYSPDEGCSTYEECETAFCSEYRKRTGHEHNISVWFIGDFTQSTHSI